MTVAAIYVAWPQHDRHTSGPPRRNHRPAGPASDRPRNSHMNASEPTNPATHLGGPRPASLDGRCTTAVLLSDVAATGRRPTAGRRGQVHGGAGDGARRLAFRDLKQLSGVAVTRPGAASWAFWPWVTGHRPLFAGRPVARGVPCGPPATAGCRRVKPVIHRGIAALDGFSGPEAVERAGPAGGEYVLALFPWPPRDPCLSAVAGSAGSRVVAVGHRAATRSGVSSPRDLIHRRVRKLSAMTV